MFGGVLGLALFLGAALLGVVLLAMVAWSLGLGGDERIRNEAQARELAEASHYGFDPVEVALDRAGIGALLRDAQGRVMLLRRHGARFAARLLESHDDTRLDRNFLTIGTRDRFFGTVTLDLGPQAQVWAGSLRRLRG